MINLFTFFLLPYLNTDSTCMNAWTTSLYYTISILLFDALNQLGRELTETSKAGIYHYDKIWNPALSSSDLVINYQAVCLIVLLKFYYFVMLTDHNNAAAT